MAESQIVFLMYHELELAGRPLCQSEPGYVRYILTVEDFRAQMDWLKRSNRRGINVSESLRFASAPSVCITFDDGCETDFIAALPVLKDFGLEATFYLTAGCIGKQGYLSPNQVRELDSAGGEIGCHSMSHPYLSDVSDQELKTEIHEAKLLIENLIGHPIQHFSCPGGRYDRRTLEEAKKAGFATVANSQFHANTASTNPFELGRIAIQRNLSREAFAETCAGRGLWKKRLQLQARRSVQHALGNRAYDRIRSVFLGGRP